MFRRKKSSFPTSPNKLVASQNEKTGVAGHWEHLLLGWGTLGTGTWAQGSPLALPSAVGYGSEPPHHPRGFGLKLSSFFFLQAPAGLTLSFSPADRLMVPFTSAMPCSISGVDLNPQVPAGKQRQEHFPAAQECCKGREVHYRQIAMCSDSNC